MVCLGLEPLESTELWLHLHFKLDLVVVDFKRKRELKRTFDQDKCPLTPNQLFYSELVTEFQYFTGLLTSMCITI